MKRREFIKYTLGISAGFVSGCGKNIKITESSLASKPNILFIMSDDHAYQALSCYGSPYFKTPNIDRLASEGMLFENAFVTNSICAPSRAAILTGKYSHLNGLKTNINPNPVVAKRDGYQMLPFDNDQQTFPKILQQNGYYTAMIGKWHLEGNPQGFDWWDILLGQGGYFDPVTKRFESAIKHKGYTTDILTDLTIEKIDECRNSEKPFMIMCHHKATHDNWLYPERFANLYEDTQFPYPASWNDDYKGREAAEHADLRVTRLKWVDYPEDASEDEIRRLSYQAYMKRYGRCAAALDENIGRILDYLDESGLSDNTMVVYTTDNGMFLGEHGWYDKRFMYEQPLRVPLVVRYPEKIKPGSVSDAFTLNIDYAPTFLEYAGADIPSDMQGKSLRPLLEGKPPQDWRDSIYYRYYEYPGPHKVYPHYGVRTERYKLIYFNTIDKWEFYDLNKYPHEMVNSYDDPAYEKTIQSLKKKLKRLRKKYKDFEN